MSDPENKNQVKGFKGLQSLGSKSPESSVLPERKGDKPALPSAWEETNTQQAAQPHPRLLPPKSRTAVPPWRGWVIGLGSLGAIGLFVVWASNQSTSSNSYPPSPATGSSYAVSEPSPTEPPPGPTITMPPVGNGLVLTSDQIRYCVYEDRRIKGAEKVVNNYDQSSVSRYNAMIDDYNSRCSNFQYRRGALTPIEREADQIHVQLEHEGRERMTNGDAAAADAAQALADIRALRADAAAEAADAAAVAAILDASAYEANAPIGDDAPEDKYDELGTDTQSGFESATAPQVDEYPRTYETSFDCDKARSIPEYLICHDPLLAEDDRELAQLYQQAKVSVTDSAGLKERMRKQWNYREKHCRDRRCLSDWYLSQKDVMRKVAQTGDAYAQ